MINKKNLIRLILPIIVTISTSIILIGFTINFGLFNSFFIEEGLRISGYYDDKQEELQDSLTQLIKEFGLPKSVTDDVISGRRVILDTKKSFASVMSDTADSYDTSELETALSDNINVYFISQGVSIDSLPEGYMKNITSKAAAMYKSNIVFDAAKPYKNFVTKYKPTIKTLICAAFIVNIVCFILLIFNHRRKYRGVREFNYGVIAGSVLSGIVTLYMKNAFISQLTEGDSYYNALAIFCAKAFARGIYTAIAGITCAAVIFVSTYILRKKAI